MPENYYCPDNFFKKMTDLDSPRKNNDCYFYYYSTCAKGDSCTFRHEPSALGCETMCSFWKEGKCLNVHCNFRHMELRKNRKVIPCYWESQPNGCLKPHCPFMHQSGAKAATTADDTMESKTDSGTESADNTMNEKLNQMSEKSFKNTPVDSLVVNFEEESDNESATSNSPIKATHRIVKVKTLEEIKLEKIQAESAAYYSYPSDDDNVIDDGDNLRKRILQRIRSKPRKLDEFKITTAKKRPIIDSGLLFNSRNVVGNKKQKIQQQTTVETAIDTIKIKTLDEIRAERSNKSNSVDQMPAKMDDCDSAVSSSTTCLDDNSEAASITNRNNQRKKIKLKRKLLSCVDENAVTSVGVTESSLSVSSDVAGSINKEDEVMTSCDINDNGHRAIVVASERDESTKTMDEVLLLEDDDDNSNVSLKAEEDLLNEIDDLLKD